ncbi:hypothetical protein DFH08DRAFT_930488 [Mycena albidolilacea]|uniref:Uncharacterized protein n=1 Tax=Mycena albidolilacea TaxID=1033008 RepID=A0AAD7AQW2_9AGAR|nr:hypothetical protein DFH08DRAFT_930488 [Mycena albidolilacea]
MRMHHTRICGLHAAPRSNHKRPGAPAYIRSPRRLDRKRCRVCIDELEVREAGEARRCEDARKEWRGGNGRSGRGCDTSSSMRVSMHGAARTSRCAPPPLPRQAQNPGAFAQTRRPCRLDCERRRVRTGELQVGNGLRDAREKRRGVSRCSGRGVRCILEREGMRARCIAGREARSGGDAAQRESASRAGLDTEQDAVVGGGVVAEQRLRGGGHVLGALLGVSGGTVAETRAARWIRPSRGVHVGWGRRGMLGRVVLVAVATGGSAVGLHGIEAPDDEHLWAQVELGVGDEVGHNDPDDSAPEPARAVNTVNTSTPRERMGRGTSPRLRPTWQGYGGKRRDVADERDLGLGGAGVAAGDSRIGRGLKDNGDDGLA